MAVIRNRYNAKNQFIILDQATTWNENLSLKAVGLWARCISRPDNWSFIISEMASNGKEKERAIYAAIRELKEANLCVFMQHRIKGQRGEKKINRIFSTEYFFFQVPLTEEEREKFIKEENEKFKIFLQDGGFVDVAFVDVENDGLTKNKGTYIEKETEPNADEPIAKQKHPNATLEEIGLSGNQYGKLLKEFGKEKLDQAIEFLKKQPTFIDNPFGWLKKCIKENWIEQSTKKDTYVMKNRTMAELIEGKTKGKLMPNCSIEATLNEIIFTRGTKILIFAYHLANFEEKVKAELERMNLLKMVFSNGG